MHKDFAKRTKVYWARRNDKIEDIKLMRKILVRDLVVDYLINKL